LVRLQFVSCLTYKSKVGHVLTEKMWADVYLPRKHDQRITV